VTRVLVVDDNLMNVELAGFLLEAGGFELDTAADARQAMSCIARSKPDLILLDIQLPGIDGAELVRRLKAEPSTQRIVVVAFTAYAMPGDEARFLAAGFDGYVAKPIEVATFVRTVSSFVRAPV
jgi:two-component system, cell cycle response regulator DivK